MSYTLWTIMFYFIGSLYLIDWFIAQNKCKSHDKWLMFTPFWPFVPKSFEPDAVNVLKRARVYIIFCAILIFVWKMGIIN